MKRKLPVQALALVFTSCVSRAHRLIPPRRTFLLACSWDPAIKRANDGERELGSTQRDLASMFTACTQLRCQDFDSELSFTTRVCPQRGLSVFCLDRAPLDPVTTCDIGFNMVKSPNGN